MLFKDLVAVDVASRQICELRSALNLAPDYEFHLSRNSKLAKSHFICLLQDLDFSYIFVSARKGPNRSTASYEKLVAELFSKASRVTSQLNIKMDENPMLRQAIRAQGKNSSLKIRCKEVRSKNNDLVQIADYVASLSVKQLKGWKIDAEWYKVEKLKRLRNL